MLGQMVTTKPKSTFTCSSCKANHVQWMGRCHFCKSWNTITEGVVAPKKKDKSGLDIWYEFQRDYALENTPCKCENCGKPIRSQLLSKDMWIWRGAICHIIPKGKYPSIGTHLHNFFLACLDCHSKFDSSWDKAVTMPVFAIAKTKFKLFKSCITEPISKIEKYFE
jgi:5-methylcytosine-specific restriction endonuclease McrA